MRPIILQLVYFVIFSHIFSCFFFCSFLNGDDRSQWRKTCKQMMFNYIKRASGIIVETEEEGEIEKEKSRFTKIE